VYSQKTIALAFVKQQFLNLDLPNDIKPTNSRGELIFTIGKSYTNVSNSNESSNNESNTNKSNINKFNFFTTGNTPMVTESKKFNKNSVVFSELTV
jgi:hypothetical protein